MPLTVEDRPKPSPRQKLVRQQARHQGGGKDFGPYFFFSRDQLGPWHVPRIYRSMVRNNLLDRLHTQTRGV